MTEDKLEKFHCQYCGKEVSKEEYDDCEGCCEDCYNDLLDEDLFF